VARRNVYVYAKDKISQPLIAVDYTLAIRMLSCQLKEERLGAFHKICFVIQLLPKIFAVDNRTTLLIIAFPPRLLFSIGSKCSCSSRNVQVIEVCM
jgi:hypothetical protein